MPVVDGCTNNRRSTTFDGPEGRIGDDRIKITLRGAGIGCGFDHLTLCLALSVVKALQRQRMGDQSSSSIMEGRAAAPCSIWLFWEFGLVDHQRHLIA